MVQSNILRWSSPIAGSGRLYMVPSLSREDYDLLALNIVATAQQKREEQVPQEQDPSGSTSPESQVESQSPEATSQVEEAPTENALVAETSVENMAGSIEAFETEKLLLSNGNSVSAENFAKVTRFWTLRDIKISKKESLNKFIYTAINLEFEIFEQRKDSLFNEAIIITVAGFDADAQKSFQNALSEIPKQLLSQLVGQEDEISGTGVVEILNASEIIVNLGKNDDVLKGSTFTLIKYVDGSDNDKLVKVFGQVIVYHVLEEYSYCQILYADDEILVGDAVRFDKRIGLTTQVRSGFLGAMNLQSDLDTSGLGISTGHVQAGAGFFGEMLGFVGVRQIVDYGTSLVRPFFGLDFFIDGAVGTEVGGISPDKLYAVGNIEGEGFAYRRSFLGLMRPYLGFQLEWNLNRVTLAPNLAAGFIFNAPFAFVDGGQVGSLPPSGSEYESVAASVMNYFTLETGLDVEVRIDQRFSFLFNVGYQAWVGNSINLKGVIDTNLAEGAVSLVENEDFLKFYDWQFLTIGMGFSVSY